MIVFTTDPEFMQQNGQFASDRHDSAFLGGLAAALCQTQSPGAQMALCAKGSQDVLGAAYQQAALFVQAAMAHQSKITITKDGKSGNAKSILGILALGVNQDDGITIQADGLDEIEALRALTELIENNYGELS